MIISTLAEFIDAAHNLNNEEIYDLVEFDLPENVRTELFALADVDSPEPFRSAMYALGFVNY